ncbi:MAG: hypothetical protein ACU841_06355 [Gammaproteobacteria bacterium]
MMVSIDILLGLSVIMLGVSMSVTVLSQIATNILNSRGRHLLLGLADLLQQIDPDIERRLARRIAGTVLIHPMIRDAMGRYGTTIHREEFTKLLMDLASGHISRNISETLGPEAQGRLLALLEKNGIRDPKGTLERVRLLALKLEMTHPELAGNVRQNMSLMQEANSHLVAKINTWFDQTIDRVSGRFTDTTRMITVVCSFLVACTIQLDTIALINRLSVDTELRNSLVKNAVEMGAQSEETPHMLSNLSGQNQDDIKQLLQLGILQIPKNLQDWYANWQRVNPLGIGFTVILLSLGAPFWYNALKNLLKLRSALAGKDDLQRLERQSPHASQNFPEDSIAPKNPVFPDQKPD